MMNKFYPIAKDFIKDKLIYCFLNLALLFFAIALSPAETSALGTGPLVSTPSEFGVTPPLSEIVNNSTFFNQRSGDNEAKTFQIPHRLPTLPKSKGSGGVDPVLQSFVSQRTIPEPTLTFEGLSNADNDQAGIGLVSPPDTNGDVGPNHYVQMVNTIFQIFDRQGNPLTPPTLLSDLFASGGITGPCGTNDSGDPIVLYDHISDRWILTQFNFDRDLGGSPIPPFFQCIAVSQTGDALGSYFVYTYAMPMDIFNDFPKFGVWPDGYYMGANTFDEVDGPSVFAFDRNKMLVGNPGAEMITFIAPVVEDTPDFCFLLLPSDLDGPEPPPGTPNFFTCVQSDEFDEVQNDAIEVFAFDADFDTPENSTFTKLDTVLTAPFDLDLCDFGADLDCIPQPGTLQRLDGLSIFFSNRVQFRDFGTHQTLVVTFAVDAGDFPNHAGVRYHIIRRDLDGTFSITEQATFAPDNNHRWVPSAALDRTGNLAVGYSVSSSTVFPSIRYAGRLSTDPPNGLFQGETTLFAGGGSQQDPSGFLDEPRWGDYSAMMVDPTDDCTFWFTSEYYPASSDKTVLWQTRIGNFSFPECFNDANVTIVKTSDTESVPPNKEALITYTIEIKNVGIDEAQDVEIVDDLPPGASLFSASPECIESVPGTVLCEVGMLPSDEERVFTITIRITPEEADIINEAIVNFLGGENSSTFTIIVRGGGSGGSCTLAGYTQGFKSTAFGFLILLLPLFVATFRLYRRK